LISLRPVIDVRNFVREPRSSERITRQRTATLSGGYDLRKPGNRVETADLTVKRPSLDQNRHLDPATNRSPRSSAAFL
jgi:hypothetical protein